MRFMPALCRCIVLGMKPVSIQSKVALNNGVEIPWLGFGVFQAAPGDDTVASVGHALRTGYRHIDTAAFYENEADVGAAIAESGIPRDEIFVTTKVWNTDQGYDSTLRAFDVSVRKLGLDVVDLYLVHWPVPELYTDTWKALEKLYADGRVRAIGVSNFLEHHLETIMSRFEIVPTVNQVEFHPRLLQTELRHFCRKHRIQYEAWSPLMRGKILDSDVLTGIAASHGKTPAQVLLRWDLQHEVVTIPKSVHPERIEENAGIFDFELSEEDMRAIDALDQNRRIGPHPDEIGR